MDAWEVIWVLVCILFAVALLAFSLYCCYLKSVHMKYDHIPGAPRVSFFLGHGPLIWRKMKNQELLLDLFLQWAEEYGPILRFNVFHKVTVLVLSPEGVKECLVLQQCPKDRAAYQRAGILFGERFLGNSLLIVDNHDQWHKQRRIMDPAFSRSHLIGLMGTFNEQADKIMKGLEEKANGETKVDMMSMLHRVTLDIIGKVGLGLEQNTRYDDQTPFLPAISTIMKGVAKSRIPLFQYMPWNRKIVKEIQEKIRLLRHAGKKCIEERRKAIQNGEEIPLDILSQILKGAAQEEDSCNEENMLDNFVNFFIGGIDTCASHLTFTILELAREPEMVTKLQAEVDEIIGVKRDIAYEDLGKLQYLSQVLKESLRLYPTVPYFNRCTRQESTIEGVKIPAHTSLLFSPYVMGRTERVFKNPLNFNPDRFSKDQPKPYYSYFPFSLGSRSCIGQVFAQMETKVVMAKFLQRFEFQLVPPQSFKLTDAGALKPSDGLVCRLKLRTHLG